MKRWIANGVNGYPKGSPYTDNAPVATACFSIAPIEPGDPVTVDPDGTPVKWDGYSEPAGCGFMARDIDGPVTTGPKAPMWYDFMVNGPDGPFHRSYPTSELPPWMTKCLPTKEVGL